MKLIAFLIFIFFLGLAILSLITGIGDCYDYLTTDANPTGLQVAWAVVRIVPLAEILLAAGIIIGGLTGLFSNR